MQNKSPLISVIVAVYNMEKYLGNCLDSLVNQTFKDIEIICVNDGSNDNSLSILEEYAAKDKRVIVINQENKGLGGARNTALDVACGKYFCIVDSDDFLDLDSLELRYNAIKKYNCDCVFVDYNIVSATGNFVGNVANPREYNKILSTEDIILKDTLYSWQHLFNREKVKHIRTIENTIYEDFFYNAQIFMHLDTIVHIQGGCYNYRHLKNSSAGGDSLKVLDAPLLFKYYNDLIKRYKNHPKINILKTARRKFQNFMIKRLFQRVPFDITYNEVFGVYLKSLKTLASFSLLLMFSLKMFLFSFYRVKGRKYYKYVKLFGIKFKVKRKYLKNLRKKRNENIWIWKTKYNRR